MKCPSCNEIAASFLRFSFSMQGVSFARSMKGHFRCQNCGALLRVGSFTREMWILQAIVIVVLVVFVFVFQKLMVAWGMGITTMIWLLLVVLIVSVFTVGLWKFGRATIVDERDKNKEMN